MQIRFLTPVPHQIRVLTIEYRDVVTKSVRDRSCLTKFAGRTKQPRVAISALEQGVCQAATVLRRQGVLGAEHVE